MVEPSALFAVEKRAPGYECKEGEIPVEKVNRDEDMLLGEVVNAQGANSLQALSVCIPSSCARLVTTASHEYGINIPNTQRAVQSVLHFRIFLCAFFLPQDINFVNCGRCL